MSASAETIPVTVTEVVEVTGLVKRFRLERRDGAPLPAFSGGAHVVVEMVDGEQVRRNPYSLMGSPFDRSHYAISVRRDDEGRGGSLFLHREVRPGSALAISPPVNLFPLDLRAKKHLMLAGGIGITPFMAMAEQLAALGARFELHYKARSTDRAAYRDALHARFGGRVHSYCGDLDQELDVARLLAGQPLGTHLYVCGPEGMIDSVCEDAAALGWPPAQVHFERFLAPPTGEPFTVRLAASGREIAVGADQSLLEALEAAGVEAPFLCRGGACGQCETDVLQCDGEILHNDHWLTDEQRAAGDKIMPCVSRFRGTTLILDR